MKFYMSKEENPIDKKFLSIGDDAVISEEDWKECTEEEYNSHIEQINIERYGTVEEREIKKKIEELRNRRKVLFNAFDIYKSNLYYGIETETETERNSIIVWYNAMLDITENNGENPIPEIPEKIVRYLI